MDANPGSSNSADPLTKDNLLHWKSYSISWWRIQVVLEETTSGISIVVRLLFVVESGNSHMKTEYWPNCKTLKITWKASVEEKVNTRDYRIVDVTSSYSRAGSRNYIDVKFPIEAIWLKLMDNKVVILDSSKDENGHNQLSKAFMNLDPAHLLSLIHQS